MIIVLKREYIYIYKYRHHSLFQTNLVKWYRHRLSIEFYQDPFQFPRSFPIYLPIQTGNL